jgi:membrane protease YdiL (CAAX protease family)
MFVVVLLGLSVPFWILGARTKLFLGDGLPVSALMAVCPLGAAVLLTRVHDGAVAVRDLLRRPFDYWKVEDARWVAVAVTLKPGLVVLSYILMRSAGLPIPLPQPTVRLAAVAFAAFFIAAVAEETGWTAYATDVMARSHRTLLVGIAIGAVWAAWHLIPLWQANRSTTWITWHALETIASRVLMVWLYRSNGGCVFLPILYHAADNVGWLLLPGGGSQYTPQVTAPLTVAAAVAAFAAYPPAPSGVTDTACRRAEHRCTPPG